MGYEKGLTWQYLTLSILCMLSQWRSQNAKSYTHQRKLLDQAVILSNCVPFQNENFSERKEFAPRRSEFFPLRAVPYCMENHFYNIG